MKDGGPAFPHYEPVKPMAEDSYFKGMSLRDWFAGMALQGMYAGNVCDTNGDTGLYARASYIIADAMLQERER